MSTLLSHKIVLDPTLEQQDFSPRSRILTVHRELGLSRMARAIPNGRQAHRAQAEKSFNALRRIQFPWTYDVHRNATPRPFADLLKAFINFGEGRAEYRESFYVACDRLQVEGEAVTLPKMGTVQMREALRFEGKILGATVSREADQWFISIQVRMTSYVPVPGKPRGMWGWTWVSPI